MTDQYLPTNINNPRGSRTVTSDTQLNQDDGFVVADSAADVITLTLPDARLVPSQQMCIKAPSAATFAVTIAALIGQTVDGVASIALTTSNAFAILKSDGTNWKIVSLSSGSTTDRDVQTARIVVGNTGAGDTIDDVDFLDIGDGAAVAAAILAATGTTADIFVKTGTYDFSLVGSPGVLAIPADMRFRGAARTGPSGGPFTGTTFVLSGTQRQLMTVGARSRVSDFTVIIPDAAPGAVGTSVVDLPLGSPRAEHIQLDFTGVPANADETLTAGFNVGSGADIRFCGTRANGGYTSVATVLAAFRLASSARALDCDGDSLNVGFLGSGSNYELVDCRAIGNSVSGFDISGEHIMLSACRSNRSTAGTGLIIRDDRVVVTGCIFDGQSAGGTVGINMLAGGFSSAITGCLVRRNFTGIIDSGTGNSIDDGTYLSGNVTSIVNGAAVEPRRGIARFFSSSIFIADTGSQVGQTVRYDPTGVVMTISAPASPAIGDLFAVKNVVSDPTAITVSGNGNPIEDLVIPGTYGATTTAAGAGFGGTWVFDGTNWLIP